MVLFSDSLGFFTSIALGFVPKDPNWSGNGPKQNFQKTLKTCLTGAQFGSFGTNKSAIDVRDAKEAENSIKAIKNLETKTCFRPFPKIGKPGKLV